MADVDVAPARVVAPSRGDSAAGVNGSIPRGERQSACLLKIGNLLSEPARRKLLHRRIGTQFLEPSCERSILILGVRSLEL